MKTHFHINKNAILEHKISSTESTTKIQNINMCHENKDILLKYNITF